MNLKSLAEKEDLVFCDKTEYIGYYLNDKLVGFSGYIEYKNKVIFKNHFVVPEYRRRGIFTEMFNYLMSIFTKPIEATCTDMSINLYLKNNFKIIKTYKKFKKVRNENIK